MMERTDSAGSVEAQRLGPSVGRIFLVFLRLGCTSFGGPVAHIGYFRDAFVRRLRWLDEASFADLVALCQFLPGPASSQVGMGIGLELAGLRGAIAAFLGFTLPSAILMALFAYGIGAARGSIDAGILSGLAIVAVAVVAEAVRGMARSLVTSRAGAAIALAALVAALLLPGSLTQVEVLLVGGLVGYAVGGVDAACTPAATASVPTKGHMPPAWLGGAALALFALLLFGLPVLAGATGTPVFGLLEGLYRAGALVFGGGHVVLPLLKESIAAAGFVPESALVAGYGAAQAMPGPLFSLAAYIGVAAALPSPWLGGILATLALFAPAFLLVVGVLPFWRSLRRVAPIRRALGGVNAAVVGLLAAALYDPVFTTAIHRPRDLAFAVVCYGLLVVARLPAWVVVIAAAGAGWIIGG